MNVLNGEISVRLEVEDLRVSDFLANEYDSISASSRIRKCLGKGNHSALFQVINDSMKQKLKQHGLNMDELRVLMLEIDTCYLSKMHELKNDCPSFLSKFNALFIDFQYEFSFAKNQIILQIILDYLRINYPTKSATMFENERFEIPQIYIDFMTVHVSDDQLLDVAKYAEWFAIDSLARLVAIRLVPIVSKMNSRQIQAKFEVPRDLKDDILALVEDCESDPFEVMNIAQKWKMERSRK